jgi:AcrR family transcriptional regulator
MSRILDEAIALIDAKGLEAFSFRILASRLGCQAMSLYHYFPSKAHLCEALVDQLIAEAMDYDQTGDWQTRLRAAAHAYRKMALRHPGMFMYFSSFRLNNHAGLGFLEGILRIYEDSGLVPEDRARHYRILGHYLVGACLDEVVKGPSATSPVPFEEARAAYPGLMAVGPYFVGDRQKTVFDAGIDLLIAGIEADLGRGTAPLVQA